MSNENPSKRPVKTDSGKTKEINPGKTGNKTEVNLDKSKTKTYDKSSTPKRK